MVEYCNWIRYFGDYAFKTDCGHYQGIAVRPKQKMCFCGKRIKRYVQQQDYTIKELIK